MPNNVTPIKPADERTTGGSLYGEMADMPFEPWPTPEARDTLRSWPIDWDAVIVVVILWSLVLAVVL